MPRVAGVDIPEGKIAEVALTYIYGVGRAVSLKILNEAGIDPNKRAKDLDEKELSRIRGLIEKRYRVEGELRRFVSLNIKRLKDIGCYRGLRHVKNLPVRGQRTRTNARTKKGRRQLIGGVKRKEF